MDPALAKALARAEPQIAGNASNRAQVVHRYEHRWTDWRAATDDDEHYVYAIAL